MLHRSDTGRLGQYIMGILLRVESGIVGDVCSVMSPDREKDSCQCGCLVNVVG